MLCESFNFETYMKKYIYRYREVQLSQTPEGGLILYTVSIDYHFIEISYLAMFSGSQIQCRCYIIKLLIYQFLKKLSHIRLDYVSICITTSQIHYNTFIFTSSDNLTECGRIYQTHVIFIFPRHTHLPTHISRFTGILTVKDRLTGDNTRTAHVFPIHVFSLLYAI